MIGSQTSTCYRCYKVLCKGGFSSLIHLQLLHSKNHYLLPSLHTATIIHTLSRILTTDNAKLAERTNTAWRGQTASSGHLAMSNRAVFQTQTAYSNPHAHSGLLARSDLSASAPKAHANQMSLQQSVNQGFCINSKTQMIRRQVSSLQG